MGISVVDTLAIGDVKPSPELAERMHKHLISKLGSSCIKSPGAGKVIGVCYNIYFIEFKKYVENLHLKGLKITLASLDKSNYYKRHPGGRMDIDRVFSETERLTGIRFSQKEKDVSYEIFSAIRYRALVLMTESILFFSNGKLKTRNCSRKHLLDTLWLAEEVVQMAFLQRTQERVSSEYIKTLEVSENGQIRFTVDNEIEEQTRRLQSLYALENRETSSQISQQSSIDDLIDGARRFDQFYQDTYGFTLSDVLKIFQFLILGFKQCYLNSNPAYVCQVERSKLVGILVRSTDITKEKIVEILLSLFLNSEKLKRTEFPEWHFPRETTLMTCPILCFKIGNEYHTCFSEQIIAISAASILSYPLGLKDRTHGEKQAEKYKRESTEAFEKEVADKFNQGGFVTRLQINTTKTIGEVDVLAYHMKKRILVVAECKAPKARLDPASFTYQIEEFEKWIGKFTRKVNYIYKNFNSIHGFDNYDVPTEIIPILVTQRPWATTPSGEFEVIHILELDSLIRRIVT